MCMYTDSLVCNVFMVVEFSVWMSKIIIRLGAGVSCLFVCSRVCSLPLLDDRNCICRVPRVRNETERRDLGLLHVYVH